MSTRIKSFNQFVMKVTDLQKTATACAMAVAVLTVFLTSSCGGDNAGVAADATKDAATVGQTAPVVAPPKEVAEIVSAVTRNDARRFASAVSYPLERPYPLRDVDDSVKMAIYYPVMVDDSLRNVLRNAPAEEWSQNGWKGWTLQDGRYLWIDDKLYALNYISVAEKAMINTLAREEIGSLHSDMREGWTPVFCLHGVDNGAVYRVDARSEADDDAESPYRLAVYEHGVDLHGRPSMSMRGHLEVDGSAGMRTFMFNGRDGSRACYVYDRLSEDDPHQIVLIGVSGDSVAHRVERAYWRDYLTSRVGAVARADK